MSRWARFWAWRAKRRHEALRAWQRSQGLYIVDEFAATPIARGVGGLSPASVLPPPMGRGGIDMRLIGADMEPDLGARKAARKWASGEKAADERPHLSGLIVRLCDEHEQMHRALLEISAMDDTWQTRRAVEGLRGIES